MRIILAFLMAALLLAGCGGGTGGTPTAVTVRVEDPSSTTPPSATAAYQLGNAAWQSLPLSPSGNSATGSFNLSGATRYGVAVRCGSQPPQVLQATPGELAQVKFTCGSPPSSGVSFTVNVSVSGVTGDMVYVQGRGGSKGAPLSGGSSGGSATVSFDPSDNDKIQPGPQDLVALVFDSGANEVRAAKVFRNQNVQDGAIISLSIDSGDVRPARSVSVSGFGSGAFAGVFWITGSSPANATAALVSPGSITGSTFAYREVAGAAGGDRYAFFGLKTFGSSEQISRFKVFPSGNLSISAPARWTPGALRVNTDPHPEVSGLSYTGTVDGLSVKAYQVSLGAAYTVSTGWLGGAASYRVPDLSGVMGFTPPSASNRRVGVGAILANQLVELFDSSWFFLPNTDLAAASAEGQQTGSDLTLP